MDFIEFKGINRFLQTLKRVPEDERQTKIKLQINRFDFEGKIRDSMLILSIIARKSKLSLSSAEFSEFNHVPKKYIIVIDKKIENDSIKNIAYSMAF